MKHLLFFAALMLTLSTLHAQTTPQDSLNNALFEAVKANDLPRVKQLVTQGADVNATKTEEYQEAGLTPLHYACMDSVDFNIAKLLLKNGADINKATKNGYTPLHYACKFKDITFVQYLIRKKADIHVSVTKDPHISYRNTGYTPLHFAAENPNGFEIVTYLVKKGAIITPQFRQDHTPLHIAARQENGLETVKFLVENGADINFITSELRTSLSNSLSTPLMSASINENGLAIIKYLLSHGAVVNLTDSFGRTALTYACRNKNGFETVKLLIEHGSRLDSESIYGCPLCHACSNENGFAIVKLLLDNGADLHATNATPLFRALWSYDISRLLLERGAKANEKEILDVFGNYYLLRNENNLAVLRLLIENGVGDINAETTNGTLFDVLIFNAKHNPEEIPNLCELTKLLLENKASIHFSKNAANYIEDDCLKDLLYPYFRLNALLLIAIKENNFTTVKKLIEIDGADVNAGDENFVTPLMWAVYKGNLEIVKLLKAKGGKVYKEAKVYYSTWNYYEDLVSIAAGEGKIEILKYLIEDMGLNRQNNGIALNYAISNNQSETAKYLIEHGADVNYIGQYNRTPLYYAVFLGIHDIATLLIKKGSDVNAEKNNGVFILSRASFQNDIKMAKILLENGADVNAIATDNNGQTALHQAKSSAMAELLISHGADLEIYDNQHRTPLHHSVYSKNKEAANYLIKNGADINSVDNKKNSVLFDVISNGWADTYNLFISKGAATNTINKYGEDIFDVILQTEQSFALLPILSGCTDVNNQNEKGNTYLHLAAKSNNEKLVSELIIMEADVNIQNTEGQTALHEAVKSKNIKIVKLLVTNGANTQHTDENGLTALDIAKHLNLNDIQNYLNNNQKNEKKTASPRFVMNVLHESGVNSLAVSKDNKYIASGSEDNTIKLWELNNGKEIRTFKGHTGRIVSVAIFPDCQKMISCGTDKRVFIWDMESGTIVFKSEVMESFINTLAVSPDGKIFITGHSDNKISIWNKNGILISTLDGHTQPVQSVAFSPDGLLFASAGSDNKIIIWNIKTKKQIALFEGHTDIVNDVEFSPDSKLIASCSKDNSVRIWSINERKEIKHYNGHTSDISVIKFTPSGQKIVSGANNLIFEQSSGFGHTELKSSDATTNLTIWDFKNGQSKSSKIEHDIKDIVFSNDSNFIIATYDKTLLKSNINLSSNTFSNSFVTCETYSAEISNTKRYIAPAASGNKFERIFDFDELKVRHFETLKNGYIYSYSFDRNDSLMISCGSNSGIVKFYNLRKKEIINVFEWDNNTSVKEIKLIPNSQNALIANYDGKINRIDLISGKTLTNYSGNSEKVYSIQIVDSSRFFSSSREGISLWDIHSAKEIKQEKKGGLELQISNDKKKLAIYGGEDIEIATTDSLSTIKVLSGHKNNVSSVSFSEHDKFLLSASADGTIKLWDVNSGDVIKTFKGYTSEITFVSFLKNENFFVSGGIKEHYLRVWSVKSKQPICYLTLLDSTDWVITTPSGLFDASPGAMDKMHYVVGLEVVELSQLKARYYEPGLLKKIMNGETLRDVQGFNNIKLPPHVELSPIRYATSEGIAPQSAEFEINLQNNFGGGIGQVKVFINGKEVIEDVRPKTNPQGFQNPEDFDARFTLTVSLADYANYLQPGVENLISVQAFNGDNSIISRAELLSYTPPVPTGYNPDQIPDVYIVSIGVSDYHGDKLDLNFAAKDAEDIMTALKTGAETLFGKDKVHSYLLTSPISARTDVSQAILPTKANIESGFYNLADALKPNDILIVYLSGHGINLNIDGEGDFYYLTSDAFSNDLADYTDAAIRDKTTVKSSEFVKLLTKNPANKQVLIIDACHSGKAVENLTAQRDMSSETVRALDRMRDRTGMHIITGSTADAVSYESNQFGQGLLTYSLLEGMKGAALREGQFADVAQLFQKARERVPVLAEGIGGIQEPVIFSPYLAGKYENGAESFDIGKFDNDAKTRVPLSQSKPVFVMCSFQNAETFADNLGLEQKTDEKLRELTAKGKDAPLILYETRDFPGAYKLRGQYSVSGNQAEVKVNIFKNNEKIAQISVTENTSNITILVEKIISEVQKAVSSY